MKKSERQIEVLLESLVEVVNIEKVIDSLPRGYISVKVISGHTYYYRQWREGNKIISSYVPESYLNVIKQKIEIRKQNEQLFISYPTRNTLSPLQRQGVCCVLLYASRGDYRARMRSNCEPGVAESRTFSSIMRSGLRWGHHVCRRTARKGGDTVGHFSTLAI